MSVLARHKRPSDFIWATGIEDTFVPQTRKGHRPLDEYQLMGHYQHWREDLILAQELGVRAIRWGIPWYRVEPFPGEFDWRWTDDVIPYLVKELGITPIVDLMHYGCPFWLRREFVSNAYPEAVATYAGAFAARYAGLVRWYTPLNEPLVTALMCGRRGTWPPYLRSEVGYLQVLVKVAQGIVRTCAAIRAADPEAILVHVEACGLSRTAREDLQALAEEDRDRGFLPTDLVTGRVNPNHRLFGWLVRNGTSPDELDALAAAAPRLDLIGLNFYPQWSTTQLYIDKRGRLAYRPVEQEGSGFSGLIEEYWARYGIPVMVTETSAAGGEDIRARWLESSVAAVRELRSRGVPVLGYTWFPLFTMIDWRYRFGRGPLEEYRLELGLYTLDGGGPARWRPTPLVEQFHSYVSAPDEAIGTLEHPPA